MSHYSTVQYSCHSSSLKTNELKNCCSRSLVKLMQSWCVYMVCVYIHMCVYVCMYIYIYICMYVCMYVCVYIYIYIYIHHYIAKHAHTRIWITTGILTPDCACT